MLRRALPVVVVGGWTAACGAFGSGPDLAPEATAAGGAPDAAAFDASAVGDAGVDAASAPCNASVLCERFETDGGSLAWTTRLNGAGSSASVVAGGGRGGTGGLVTNTSGKDACSFAQYELDVPTKAAGFDLEVAMQRSAGDADGVLYVGLGASCGVLFRPSATAASSNVERQDTFGGSSSWNTSIGPVPPDAWVSLHVRFESVSGTFVVDVDGQRRVTDRFPTACTSGAPKLFLGPQCTDVGRSVTVAFDDVRLESLD